jgi:hypothetical protein
MKVVLMSRQAEVAGGTLIMCHVIYHVDWILCNATQMYIVGAVSPGDQVSLKQQK